MAGLIRVTGSLALDPAELDYKGLAPVKTDLVAWLERMAQS